MTLLFGRRKAFKNEMRNMNLLTLIIIVFPENKISHTHTHTHRDTYVCVCILERSPRIRLVKCKIVPR